MIPRLGRTTGEGIGYPLQYSWASLVTQLVKNSCNARDLGSIPELGRSLGEGIGYPLQYSGLGNSTVGSPWGRKESDMMSSFHFYTFICKIAGGRNNRKSPLRLSCCLCGLSLHLVTLCAHILFLTLCALSTTGIFFSNRFVPVICQHAYGDKGNLISLENNQRIKSTFFTLHTMFLYYNVSRDLESTEV